MTVSKWHNHFNPTGNQWLKISSYHIIVIIVIYKPHKNKNYLSYIKRQLKYPFLSQHSVESPSMVDPQWNIWYWGSKWNLHTVFWSAAGSEWGTTPVYFGITCVWYITSRLPVFAVEPQYLLQDFFIFVKSIIWITHTKSSKYFMLV